MRNFYYICFIMKKIIENLRKFWYFRIANPVVRKGEVGGFKWMFRRYTMRVETVSGNWKAEWTAGLHPYAYLLTGKGEENIEGFCQMMYTVGMLLTTDQKFVNAVGKALKDYDKRMQKAAEVVEDETEEKIALEEMKQVQEYVDAGK